MSSALALTPLPDARPERRTGAPAARFAHSLDRAEPPAVEELEAGCPGELVEALFERAAAASRVPVLALREIVENLVHAGFAGAVVSVLDGGQTVRVSDRGPGIADKARALEPGFSSACEEARRVVRGVGSGLAVAALVLEQAGGTLELEDNLGGGTVVTLCAPGDPGADGRHELSGLGRRILALLLELDPSDPARVAAELDEHVCECGRELVLLEHRGLVARAPEGARSLTPDGTRLVAALF